MCRCASKQSHSLALLLMLTFLQDQGAFAMSPSPSSLSSSPSSPSGNAGASSSSAESSGASPSPPYFPLLKPPALRYSDWVKSELYFGLSIQDKHGHTTANITQAQFESYIHQEIAPRFPHGWTVYNASGAWMSQAQPGLVVEEGSKVLVLFHPTDSGWQERIAEAVEAYRSRFHQEAVLYSSINAQVCITNETCLSTSFFLEMDAAGRVGQAAPYASPRQAACETLYTIAYTALCWAPALLAIGMLRRQQEELRALRYSATSCKTVVGAV